MGRRQRSDAQQSRAALLGAARELVAENGTEALTVVAVARRAGLNRSTAYQHFRSRDELLRAVGEGFASDLRTMFGERRDFGAQVDFFVDYFRDHPDIARIWMFHLLSGDGGAVPGWDEYVGALQRLADSSRSQDGIDAEMLGVIGMSSALVWSLTVRQRTRTREEARVETERFSRELKRLFVFGALRSEAWPELAQQLGGSRPKSNGKA